MEAVNDAGLDDFAGDKERVGVCIGSGIGGLPMIEETPARVHAKAALRKISPFFVPGSIINMISGLVSIQYGYKGPNLATVTACTTANHSIGEAARLIEYGDADIMIAGGAESTVSSARRRRLLRVARAVDAQRRPGDREPAVGHRPRRLRAGRGRRHARARGVRARARRAARASTASSTGYGMSADAHHITAPPGRRRRRAPQHGERAAQRRHAAPTDIDYINAHGTSTPLGDIAECMAREARLRRSRDEARGVVDQVDDRTPARRGRRHRGGVHRARDSRPGRAADDQPRRPAIRSAISTSCRRPPAR